METAKGEVKIKKLEAIMIFAFSRPFTILELMGLWYQDDGNHATQAMTYFL